MAIEQSKLHVAVKLSLCLAKVGYSSNIHFEATNRSLKEVQKLSKIKINEISGTNAHFLAIADDGRVFGMSKDISRVSGFTVIEPLCIISRCQSFCWLLEFIRENSWLRMEL